MKDGHGFPPMEAEWLHGTEPLNLDSCTHLGGLSSQSSIFCFVLFLEDVVFAWHWVCQGEGEGGGSGAQLDGDFLCPICMEVMKDAFLAPCGHSFFCYMCIVTHLRDKSDCPSCGRCLTVKCLYPNFPLDRVQCFTSQLLFVF